MASDTKRKNTTSRNKVSPPPIDPQQRQQQIARAAYLRAEQRGFETGGELEDWLAAEREVDAQNGERPTAGARNSRRPA